ncbi:oligosaccharide flippase family protein [Ekhidna sp.]|uniref:oligosaccharide flippase family protein n=1 Tax=Ekhidna sp. TaxID=2608089 RepID=UPI003CCB9F0B
MHKIGHILRSDNSKVQLGNLTASTLGLGTFMLLTRGLDKESFGQWAIFMACVGLVDLLRTGLGRQAMVRKVTVSEPDQHQKIIGSAMLIQLMLTAGLFAVISIASMYLSTLLGDYFVFLKWYPWLLLASTPQLFDTWIAQAKRNYGKMAAARVGVNAVFVLLCGLGLFLDFSLEHYLLSLILSNLIVSIISQVVHKSIKSLTHGKLSEIKDLLQFGKHSLASMLGANLLRSTDSLIIGSLMGAQAAATYAIPLKVIDVLEIPVRGFAMTSFSKLSRFYHEENFEAFKRLFVKSTGLLMLLFLPVGLLFFIFPALPIYVLGGEKYLDGQILIQIFVVAMVLIPLDKFLGVAFDSINRPGVNAIKVWIMVSTNVIGDLVAISLIGELWAVAMVTVINILFGISFGLWRHTLLRNLKWRSAGIIINQPLGLKNY